MSKDSIPKRFRERIQEARKKNLEIVDLSNLSDNFKDNLSANLILEIFVNLVSDRAQPLTNITKIIFQLKKQIKILKLSGNKINYLPEFIGELYNLTELDLSKN
ncbi:MAG: hypothetical protein F6K55_13510 [Moorea sp. SIO4A3]|nr:hypothetical protein [Moorena sp. SIO4A3]